MGVFALQATKWLLDIASRLVKANVRVHNLEAIQDDMAAIFVANHFTRLETLVLPYVFKKHAGLTVWSLAHAGLFQGRIGRFLLSTGAVSTKDPDRDTVIVHSLLTGDHPWIIFPEGAMIKDKKLVDGHGGFRVFSGGRIRPPHTGAAVLALRTEFYRHKLRGLEADAGCQAELDELVERFGLDGPRPAIEKRTVIIPVNITYFPIRAHDNLFLRVARATAKDLSTRAIEELSVEGSVLAEDTDIDITLGDPIDIGAYLAAPGHEELMACGCNDMAALEQDPGSRFNEAARDLMARYMTAVYCQTTVNQDHLFATLIRHQRTRRCTERTCRARLFAAARRLHGLDGVHLHPALVAAHRDLLYDEDNASFDAFLDLCVREEILVRVAGGYVRNARAAHPPADFHSIRQRELTRVIANELEPLADVTAAVREVAALPKDVLLDDIRTALVREDEAAFEADYAAYARPHEARPPQVGRPFFLRPDRIKGGVVLAHGYMAAPLEVRALAEALVRAGFAVYGARIQGHGTSPEDLAETTWQQWYDSFNRAYGIMKTLTGSVFVGGFSTGGALALLAAARKRHRIPGVFAINAPLQVRNYGVRLASSIVSLNALLARIRMDWEYIENQPENTHINYTRNPIRGASQLAKLMRATEDALERVCAPTLIIQAHRDPVVDPASATLILEKIPAPARELTLFDRENHGIINGPGAQDVFDRVIFFLEQTRTRALQDSSAR
ncbi:MAG: alpha/beta fold hydrolase [Candidatus Hydrogenedentes bacterium]|nr:alpha/beta fold hydrolase [Candidatus Hydrogenedentota bacterium]